MVEFFTHKDNLKDMRNIMNDTPLDRLQRGGILMCALVCVLAPFTQRVRAEISPATPAPVIACTEPIFEFGSRNNTEDVLHTFIVTNKGTAPLVIAQVRTGCGCTKAELDRNTIPPGESAALSTRLTLRGHSGAKHSTVYLHSNDPVSPVFLCHFNGIAIAELDVTPPALRFDLTPDSTNHTASAVLDNRTGRPLNILGLDYPSSLESVTVVTNQAGLNYTLVAKCPTTPGSMQGVVSLLTDHPRYPKIDIPLSISVIRDLNVFPPELTLRETPPDQMLESRYVILQARDNHAFNIKSIEVIPPVIPVTVHTHKPYWVRLRVGPARMAKSMDGALIRITTDVPRQPVIEIPLRVRVP